MSYRYISLFPNSLFISRINLFSQIEIPLSSDNRYHSIFACLVSKEQSTELNPPMMMSCGHVISKDSLQKLNKSGGQVIVDCAFTLTHFGDLCSRRSKCPYCPVETAVGSALRIHLWRHYSPTITLHWLQRSWRSWILSFMNCFDIDGATVTGAIDYVQKEGRCFPRQCSLHSITCLYIDFYASDHQTTLDLYCSNISQTTLSQTTSRSIAKNSLQRYFTLHYMIQL